MSFFNKKKRDAFEARKRQQRIWRLLRRLIDSKTPNMWSEEASDRACDRSSRCLPVAFVPITEDNVELMRLFYAPTKELSDNGLCLITSEHVELTECICGFWLDSLCLVHGTVRRVHPFGGNMFEVGIELVDVIDSADVIDQLDEHLRALAPAETSGCAATLC